MAGTWVLSRRLLRRLFLNEWNPPVHREKGILQEQEKRGDFYLTIHTIGGAIMGVVHAIFTCVLQKGCWQIEKSDKLLSLIALSWIYIAYLRKCWKETWRWPMSNTKGEDFWQLFNLNNKDPHIQWIQLKLDKSNTGIVQNLKSRINQSLEKLAEESSVSLKIF